MAVVINGADFEDEVLKSEIPVIVDFFAEWCQPCKIMALVIDELAQKLDGKAKVLKINIDEASDIASNYLIRSIPTVVAFKNGVETSRIVGVSSIEELEELL